MFVYAILSLSMLVMTQELSISKTAITPPEVVLFNGVTVEVDRSDFQNLQNCFRIDVNESFSEAFLKLF